MVYPYCFLACLLLGWAAASLAAAPPDTACFQCPWLDLPLDEWTAQRNFTSREVLPWGQVVEFHPIDYRRLAEELCKCVLDSLDDGSGTHQSRDAFVRAEGTQLVLRGQPFRFVGFNAAQALAWAASGDSKLWANLESLFEHAAQLGLRVGRVFAAASGPKVRPPFLDRFDELATQIDPELPVVPWLTLQPEPGALNETALQALDQLVSLAAGHGIRLNITMADYHATFGSGPAGIEPYVQWVRGSLNLTGATVLDFYTDERVKLLYKHNLCAVANRRSSVNGVKYRDDPAILSWDLINEPRCPACLGATRGATLAAWAGEMSAFMSCVAPRQLVHVGSEGYFGDTTPEFIAANPGTWSLCSGVDFVQLAALPHMGFAVAHMYEHMRGTWDEATRSDCGWECVTQWFQTWLEAHLEASASITRKPFVLEEYGKPFDEGRRNQMFRLVQGVFQAAWQNASSPAAGAMFWGASAGAQLDWDGWQLRLDGGPTVPAPHERAAELKAQMPAEQQRWLADVEAMQASFRLSVLEKLCQESVKTLYAPAYQGYSSNSTVTNIADMSADAAAEQRTPAVVAAAGGNGPPGQG